ncbi:MAG: hypothetical protein NTW71_06175 [Deltaproteobacteria bacterium]|nr:hypothetical protein [Deltaproteobacteria bacterium]
MGEETKPRLRPAERQEQERAAHLKHRKAQDGLLFRPLRESCEIGGPTQAELFPFP